MAEADALRPLAAALAARCSAVRLLDLSYSFLGDAAAEALAAAFRGVPLRAAAAGGEGEAEEDEGEEEAEGGITSSRAAPAGRSKVERLVLAATCVGAAGRAALEAAVRDPGSALRALEVSGNRVSGETGNAFFVTEPRER